MGWQREMAWHRLNERGEERCVFVCEDARCVVEGVGAAAMNGSGFVFEYRMEFLGDWTPVSFTLAAHVGAEEPARRLQRRDTGSWLVDGAHAVEFDGCTEVDFAFSPSTNTATVRHLALDVGDEATVHAIWVLEPYLELRRVEQTYKRVAADRYRLTVGDFTAEIEMDAEGLVIDYPEMFEAATSSVGE